MANKYCKYCEKSLEEIENEGLQCSLCSKYVHTNCLHTRGTPGSLQGDVFFDFNCKECSETGDEVFNRQKISWFQVIVLVLYHMNKKSSGLARKGFFHWKLHLSYFVSKHWDIIFRKDFKPTKKWGGTIPGVLSTYSPHFFTSGTSVFNEPGWWTLTYPNLTPEAQSKLNAEILSSKQKFKEQGLVFNEVNVLQDILKSRNYKAEHLACSLALTKTFENDVIYVKREKQSKVNKQKKNWLPAPENISEKPVKKICKEKEVVLNNVLSQNEEILERKVTIENEHKIKYLDPFCHYNTSLHNLASVKGITLKEKLLGKIREEPILSPYSNVYLKPYIRRDCVTVPNWLQLMAEILVKANLKNKNWTLPSRYPLDYTYVQPEHIPAINSLCNQFFWPGIDLTECLQYPDFSCVVLYKKLIVAFAFLVPDVKFHENYLSFIFTRPGWRNVGIAKFMIYHLIQMSIGKDVTLHVSINNPALCLYQKFGFKVENVDLDFYEKYMRKNTGESKHAFFCRLER